ncbi:hypothetical protein AMQ84_09580 [Paenibacillus riograndensis]|uniref:Uncharacterized protein n=1 Tax=Paenibacillus riograndensis TaxID=483937 RepID=A0A132U4D5_9BACL|nr:hypothetical protein AMQ84_09580 [Paenibacillus riograndensis]KWX86869.1 hypothetical protein AMQ83_16435 [Paenibacillus riograndensis]
MKIGDAFLSMKKAFFILSFNGINGINNGGKGCFGWLQCRLKPGISDVKGRLARIGSSFRQGKGFHSLYFCFSTKNNKKRAGFQKLA